MSDVDTLIVMFQTQLSDVMDTLVKTAMHELTRLVEDGFVEEMRRRAQDAESLRAQLQWAEKKLSDGERSGGGAAIGTTARCTDCGKALWRADGTTGEAEDEEEEEENSGSSSTADLLQYGVLIGCDLKQEDDAMELCTESNGQEVTSELAQEADVPVLIPSPVRESATTEQDDARPVVDVKKEEEVNESSCSADNTGDWPVGHDGGGSESHGMSEWADASRPDRTRQSSSEEELLMRTVIRQEEEEDKDPRGPPTTVTHTEHPRLDRTGSGGCETAIAAVVTPKRTPPVVVRVGRDHIVSSPPCARQQRFPAGTADVGTVVIKEEIIVNSEEEEGEEEEEMTTTITRSGAPLPAFAVNHQYAALPGDVLHKQGNVSHNKLVANKEAALKPYPSKVGGPSSATTPKAAALQPLGKKLAAHSPMMRGISMPSSAGAAHSQAFNLDRTPSTTLSSRSGGGTRSGGGPTRSGGVGPPPLLSFHRAHHHQNDPNNNNKRALLSLTRASSIPWVSIKTHHSQQQSSTHSSSSSSQNILLHHHGTTTTTSTPHSGSSSLPAPPSSSSQHALLRCGQCGKCFPHPSNLKAHAQTHTGERPFCCSLCGRSFTKLSNLKAHRRVHTGERPYCCLACGKRFTQKCNLKRHQRIHVDA